MKHTIIVLTEKSFSVLLFFDLRAHQQFFRFDEVVSIISLQNLEAFPSNCRGASKDFCPIRKSLKETQLQGVLKTLHVMSTQKTCHFTKLGRHIK